VFSSCPIAFNNPPPDGLASPIARVSKLFRPYCAFYIRLVAVALQHQIGDAPDVNFPGSCPAGYRAKVYVWLICRSVVHLRQTGPTPQVKAPESGRNPGKFKPRCEILYRRLKP